MDVTLPITSLKQARMGRTLIQKYDFSCGSAAVATDARPKLEVTIAVDAIRA